MTNPRKQFTVDEFVKKWYESACGIPRVLTKEEIEEEQEDMRADLGEMLKCEYERGLGDGL